MQLQTICFNNINLQMAMTESTSYHLFPISEFSYRLIRSQCPRTDLSKRFLPKQRVKGDPLRSQNNDELKSSMVGPNLLSDF